MRHLSPVKISALLLFAVSSVREADAATYFVDLAFDGARVQGTIDTDGTLGVLSSQSQITDWQLLLTQGADSVLLDGFTNSGVLMLSTPVQATLSGLYFDFSSTGGGLLFQHPYIGSGVNYFGIQNLNGFIFNPIAHIGMQIQLTGAGSNSEVMAGLFLLGSTTLLVPEPGTGILFLSGLIALMNRRLRSAKRSSLINR